VEGAEKIRTMSSGKLKQSRGEEKRRRGGGGEKGEAVLNHKDYGL
jgi:hypothetical protein